MTDNLFNFTWVEHQDTLVSLVQTIYNDEVFFDCKLYADGHHFDVHRLVLSTCSPFLNKILQEHKGDDPIITLDGISYFELRALVEYMYTGETSLSPKYLNSFFQTTKMLQIAGLSHYDNKTVSEMLKEDETKNEELEYICDNDKDSDINCLELSMKSTEEQSSVNISSSESVNESTGQQLFPGERELGDIINHNSVLYDKYHSVLVKDEGGEEMLEEEEDEREIDEDEESMDDDFESKNEALSPKRDEITVEMIPADSDSRDNSVEMDDSQDNTYTRLEHFLLKKTEDNNIEESVNIEEDADEATKNPLEIENQLADDSENYVYLRVDNNTLQKIKEKQLEKIQQQKDDKSFQYSDKYLKMINPVKKNVLIKRPKIQSLVGTDLKANPDDKKIYICLKCGNKYSHRRTLLHHIHWICDQPATYSCSLCPYMGKRKFQLKSHMKHAHMLKMS